MQPPEPRKALIQLPARPAFDCKTFQRVGFSAKPLHLNEMSKCTNASERSVSKGPIIKRDLALQLSGGNNHVH